MTSSSETFSLPCEFIRETDAAVLVVAETTGEEIWIPLSQIEEMHRKDGHGTIVMT